MGLFSSLGKSIAHYAFELLMIVIVFVIGLLVTIYATQAHTQCKKALNGSYGTISDADRVKYESAKKNLQQVVWMGWTIVSISVVFLIVLIIVGIPAIPEEGVAAAGIATEEEVEAEGAELFSKYAKNAYNYLSKFKDIATEMNNLTKRKETGLYFHACFGGWITQLIFFVMLLTVFILGIFAAMASVKLSHTQGKFGQGKAQVAAILGIVPFSVFFVWWLADLIYAHTVQSKITKLKAEGEELKREATSALPSSPVKPMAPVRRHSSTPPRVTTPTGTTTSASTQPSLASTLGSKVFDTGVNYIRSPEGQQLLASAGNKALDAVKSLLTSAS